VAAIAVAVGTAGIATTPFYTRGEPREALVVHEMLHGGGWVLPLRNGTELPRKPPFFHWLGAAVSLALGGVDELSVRLPSAATSVAVAILVLGWGTAVGGLATGALAALVATTSFAWMRAATVARVDMVYAGLLAAALVSLDRLLRGSPREITWRWVLYGATAAAVLTKGPIALVLMILTVAAVGCTRPERRFWHRLRPGRGLVVVLTIVGTWFVLAFDRHGSAFLSMVVRENLHHLVATDLGGTGHDHGAPYLMGVFLIAFLPWTPLLPLVAPALRHLRADPGILLCGIWTAVVLGVHLIASAKRPVYLLPAFPAVSLLIVAGARGAHAAATGAWVARFLPWAARTYAAMGAGVAVGALAVAWGLEIPDGLRELLSPRDRLGLEAARAAAADHAFAITLAALTLLAAAAFLLRIARGHSWEQLIAAIAIITAGVAVLFNTAIHPEIARDRSLKVFMGTVTSVVRPDEPLAFLGSADAAAVFYAGRHIPSIPRRSRTVPPSFLLVWERDWNALAPSGRLPAPIQMSTTSAPRRGRLLLVAAQPGGASVPAHPPMQSPDPGNAAPRLSRGEPVLSLPRDR
jgi:hypothetical protein